MDSNWLMPSARVRVQGYSEGERPSGSALMALVDQSDPAFLAIVGVLHEMRSAGVAFDESVVKAAVALGRAQCKTAPQPEADADNSWGGIGQQPIVYYVRRGDLVKIGTTKRPHQRFAELVPDEVLAWEPGSRAEEQARHAQFARWRLGGSEYFETNEVLGAHVDELRRIHGAPDPGWPTLATVGAIGSSRVFSVSAPDNATLVTMAEGIKALGVKRNTVDMWVRRKLLVPAGKNSTGRPLYLLSHMNELAERSGLRPRVV